MTSGTRHGRIRSAVASDVGRLVELDAAIFAVGWSGGDLAGYLDRADAGLEVFEDDGLGSVVAYACWSLAADEAELHRIAVDAMVRCQGVAGALLSAVLARVGARGGGRIVLEVARGNRAARALYERFGFVEVGVRTEYYRDPVDDALVMARDLPRSLDP